MPSSSDATPTSSDATPAGRTDVEEYWLMRRAFRDAIWDVIGSVVSVILAGALLFFGIAMASRGLLDVGGTTGLLVAAFGLVLALGAVVFVIRELRIYPFD